MNTFLYLTAMNRSAKGVEAFVSYNGQNQTFFKVFDWSRYPSAPWQTNVPFANLAAYLRTGLSHGNAYRVLPLMNTTSQSGTNYWYNQVWFGNQSPTAGPHLPIRLLRHVGGSQIGLGRYRGPIVETFQNADWGTQPMGALNTQLLSCDASNRRAPGDFPSARRTVTSAATTKVFISHLDLNDGWGPNS